MNPPNVYKKVASIEKGDHCNSGLLTLFNHNGTHLDAPRHFDGSGKKVADYKIEEFIFNRPRLVEIKKEDDEAIELNDLSRNKSEIQECDLLLVKTGFYRKRGQKSYADRNPWIDNDAAHFLRQQSNLKAIGIDAISISSYSRIGLGEETHRILLGGGSALSEPKLVIEDLDLSDDLNGIKRVFVIPLFISEADSAPCTVFAEVEREQG
jgi:kynurenine formamidase